MNQKIAAWRSELARSRAFCKDDLVELESHLVEQIDVLTHEGKTEDEAFLIAKKRIGTNRILTSEFAKISKRRLIFLSSSFALGVCLAAYCIWTIEVFCSLGRKGIAMSPAEFPWFHPVYLTQKLYDLFLGNIWSDPSFIAGVIGTVVILALCGSLVLTGTAIFSFLLRQATHSRCLIQHFTFAATLSLISYSIFGGWWETWISQNFLHTTFVFTILLSGVVAFSLIFKNSWGVPKSARRFSFGISISTFCYGLWGLLMWNVHHWIVPNGFYLQNFVEMHMALVYLGILMIGAFLFAKEMKKKFWRQKYD